MSSNDCPSAKIALETFERIFLGSKEDALDKARALLALLQELEFPDPPDKPATHGHHLTLIMIDILVEYGRGEIKP